MRTARYRYCSCIVLIWENCVWPADSAQLYGVPTACYRPVATGDRVSPLTLRTPRLHSNAFAVLTSARNENKVHNVSCVQWIECRRDRACLLSVRPRVSETASRIFQKVTMFMSVLDLIRLKSIQASGGWYLVGDRLLLRQFGPYGVIVMNVCVVYDRCHGDFGLILCLLL